MRLLLSLSAVALATSAIKKPGCPRLMVDVFDKWSDCMGFTPKEKLEMVEVVEGQKAMNAEHMCADEKNMKCVMEMSKKIAELHFRYNDCGDIIEVDTIKFSMTKFQHMGPLMCEKDENDKYCLDVVANHAKDTFMGKDNEVDCKAMFKMQQQSCCFNSYMNYNMKCLEEDDYDDHMTEILLQCPRLNFDDMCAAIRPDTLCDPDAQPGKGIPGEGASIEEVEHFCEMGKLKEDKEACEKWSCCQWDGGCWADDAPCKYDKGQSGGEDPKDQGDENICEADNKKACKQMKGKGCMYKDGKCTLKCKARFDEESCRAGGCEMIRNNKGKFKKCK